MVKSTSSEISEGLTLSTDSKRICLGGGEGKGRGERGREGRGEGGKG